MQSATALQFSYSSAVHDIVCAPDAISGLGLTVDQLGARTAMRVRHWCEKHHGSGLCTGDQDV
jgi:hypothetical protein